MKKEKDNNQIKKALMTASVASMLDNFNRSNISILLKMGYKVTLAANFDASEDSSPLSRMTAFREEMEALGCRVVQIDFSRKLANISRQLRSYHQLRRLAEEDFDLVHCNSPICAAMTRVAFRKKRKSYGTRVIYTAHGLHFFRGAPVKNWLVYFPVEWLCAHWTDVLNTVNREDYLFARKWLKARRIVRLPGVGINLEKFKPGSADREAVRRNLGIKADEKMLLSVGELSHRKNQESVIRALALMVGGSAAAGQASGAAHLTRNVYRIPDSVRFPFGHVPAKQHRTTVSSGHVRRREQVSSVSSFQKSGSPDFRLRYVICGHGEMECELKALAAKIGLADRVIFLGYREDISELCQAADLFVFPSLQEGLPMALMEAIAVKAPVVCSDVRGNRELVRERKLRFDPKKPEEIARCINWALGMDMSDTTETHLRQIKKYRIEAAERKIRDIYQMPS